MSRQKTLEDSLASFLDMIPLWKLVVLVLLISFIIAGTIEELGKWLVARRYQKIDHDPANVQLGIQIGCNGILAIVSTGALGVATAENMLYVFAISTSNTVEQFPFQTLFYALLRTSLALPLHVALQFFVGLAAAHNHVFKEGASVTVSLLLAVLIHGTFDAIAFFSVLFNSIHLLPDIFAYFVPVLQFLIVLPVCLLCQARYKALTARERTIRPNMPYV